MARLNYITRREHTNRLAVDFSTRGCMRISNMTRKDFDRMPGVEQRIQNDADKQFLYSAPTEFWSKTYRFEGDPSFEVMCFTNEPPKDKGVIFYSVGVTEGAQRP